MLFLSFFHMCFHSAVRQNYTAIKIHRISKKISRKLFPPEQRQHIMLISHMNYWYIDRWRLFLPIVRRKRSRKENKWQLMMMYSISRKIYMCLIWRRATELVETFVFLYTIEYLLRFDTTDNIAKKSIETKDERIRIWPRNICFRRTDDLRKKQLLHRRYYICTCHDDRVNKCTSSTTLSLTTSTSKINSQTNEINYRRKSFWMIFSKNRFVCRLLFRVRSIQRSNRS